MSKVSGLFQDLTTIKEARNGRLASWDQRGKNQDYWEIPAKESITLGEIEGPGCITHIWMTSSCRRVKAPSILDPVQNASAAPVMENRWMKIPLISIQAGTERIRATDGDRIFR